MPNLNQAISNHHDEVAKWWRKPEYIKARKEFCKKNPICARCGRPSQTPGHSHYQYVSGYEYYLGCVVNDVCVPLCNACNLMEKKGRKPCPICVSVKAEKIHYIGQDQDHCYWCRPAEEIQRSEDRKQAFKQLVKQSQKITNAKRRALYQEMKQNGRI